MNYQPFFGMNVLLSNEFVALLHFFGFILIGVFCLFLLIAYQKRRALNVRAGSC